MNYDDIEKKRFGRRLAIARMACRVTQRELAKAVNINFQELYRYENGLRMPRDTILEALAASLVIPVDRLKYDDPFSEGYHPPFYVREIGDNFGKEYILQHGYGSTRKVSVNGIYEKLKNLDQEELRIVEEFINGLYLDSHPDELQKVLDEEDADFEKFKKSTKKTKALNKYQKIKSKLREDVYRLFPEKYDEFLEQKKTLTDIDKEINEFIFEEYPEIAEKLLEQEEAQKIVQNKENGIESSQDDLYKLAKIIHTKVVAELAAAMKKDQKKRPSKDNIDEIYEVNLDDHILRMYKEGRIKFANDLDLENLTEKQRDQLIESAKRRNEEDEED